MATSLDLSRTYTSYSGVDIRVIINGAQVGSMQALSYAIQREKAPIYVMGSVDPISYSRGKRGIAGTMISLMLDTHILMSPSFTGEHYLGDKDEIFPVIMGGQGPDLSANSGSADMTAYEGRDTSALNDANNEVNSAVSLLNVNRQLFQGQLTNYTGLDETPGANASGPYQRINREISYNVSNLGNNYSVAPVFYVDQILPFDIAIVAVNEYGQSAQMRLYGCEILNEGSGFSIDDIVIENQMTYVCRTILPWRSFALKGSAQTSAREELYNKNLSPQNRGLGSSSSGSTTSTSSGGVTLPPIPTFRL